MENGPLGRHLPSPLPNYTEFSEKTNYLNGMSVMIWHEWHDLTGIDMIWHEWHKFQETTEIAWNYKSNKKLHEAARITYYCINFILDNMTWIILNQLHEKPIIKLALNDGRRHSRGTYLFRSPVTILGPGCPGWPEVVFLVRAHPDPCLILIRAQIRALLCAWKSKFIPA
jgi:hypothetical protein